MLCQKTAPSPVKLPHKPTPTKYLMVFMAMMQSGFLLVALAGYLHWQYLGGKSGVFVIGASGTLISLATMFVALRDMRKAAYRDAEAGRTEEKLYRRAENWNLSSAASYVYLVGVACVIAYYYFFQAPIPLGAKALLAIVLTLCVSLTLTNLRYAWMRWRESRSAST